MKHILLFSFLLLPLLAWSQYPDNPRKQRLGWQTTGAGLVYIQSGTPSHTPSTDEDAWMVLDTTNNRLYYYDVTGAAWDTIGGSSVVDHDTSAVFHRRLTFGTSYTLPTAVLDTADIISIYGGAQLGSPVTITLPTLSDTSYDGKLIYVMGSATESGEVMRVTSPDSTDVLVQGCGAGSTTGPDTISTSYRVQYLYVISNGRYYRTCQRPNVNSITYVTDTTTIDAHQGDAFINAAGDTLGLYDPVLGWQVFTGGGPQTLSTNADSLSISTGNTIKLKSDKIIDDWWKPGSLGDSYGLSADFGDTTEIINNATYRTERPNIAYNTDLNRLVVAARQSADHLYSQPAVLLYTYSDDLGRTWSALDTLWDDGATGGDPINNILSWDRQTGNFYAVVEVATNAATPNPDTDLHILTSPDGITWTPIDTIAKVDMVAEGYCGMGIVGDVIRLQNGNLLFSFYTRFASDCTTQARACHVAISADNGESWTFNLIDSTSANELNETVVIQKSNGGLVAFVRSENDSIYRFYSSDYGATWGSSTEITPGSYYRTKPDINVFSGGNMIEVYRSAAFPAAIPYYAMSSDYGDTWTSSTALPDVGSTYDSYLYGDFEPLAQNVTAYTYSLGEDAGTGDAKVYFRTVINGANSVYGTPSGLTKSTSETSSTTETIDLQLRPLRSDRKEVSNIGSLTLSLSNPIDGGRYRIHFQGSGNSVSYTLPSNMYDIGGNSLDTTTTKNWLLDCDYLDTAYYCTTTFVTSATFSAFSPTDIDSLFYWFRADSVVTDSAGGAIADYEGIGGWGDLSGNTHDLEQTSAGAYPQWRADIGPNSTPVVFFDGTDDFLTSDTAHFWESNSLTIFAVVAFADSTDTGSEIIAGRYYTTTDERQWNMWAQGFSATPTARAMTFNTSSDGGTGDVNLWEGTNIKHEVYKVHTILLGGGPDVNWYENTIEQAAGVDNATTVFDNTQNLTFGAQNGEAGGAAFFSGYIAEFLVYSRALNSSERSLVENYLNTRYNIY